MCSLLLFVVFMLRFHLILILSVRLIIKLRARLHDLKELTFSLSLVQGELD